MRVRVLPIIVALAAIAALVVHLTVPFANVTVKAEDATETSEVFTRGDLAAVYDNADEQGIPYQIVPTTGLTFMLVTLIILALSAITFAGASLFESAKAGFVAVGAGFVTAASATLAMVSNGLWTGRGIADIIEYRMLLSDGPARVMGELILDHSAMDFVSSFETISAPIVFLLLATLVVSLALGWTRQVRAERQMQAMARRHGRLALFGALSLAFILLMPLAVWTLPDALPAPEGESVDQDPFLFNAYDILFTQQISRAQAEAVGEAGLEFWSGLSTMLGIMIGTTAVAIVAAFIGLAGKHLESLDAQVLGRLLENLSLSNILVHALVLVGAVLAAFVLQHPSDFYEVMTTGLPMILVAPAGLALIYSGFVGRDVIRDDSDLVADEFPEPVIYD